MNKKRFIVVVLDSFGIGEMEDVKTIRPQDIGSNTCKHLIEFDSYKKWDNLIKLGLINALGTEYKEFKFSENACYGMSDLKHYGADTYFGHQEIMGTNPEKPVSMYFSEVIDTVQSDLEKQGFEVRKLYKESNAILCVNNTVCIGDNMETDLGQAINVTGLLDICDFDYIRKIGLIVRKHVKVARVIAFGGKKITLNDLEENIVTKNGYIGIDTPKAGVYRNDYECVHIGYGINHEVQVPQILFNKGINTYLYGKVADIVYNPNGYYYPHVDTAETFEKLIEDMVKYDEGFFCLNIQETDLAGHAQNAERYIDRLNISDIYIGKIMELMTKDDILVVMADHGNDPTTGSSKHTREKVPILVYNKTIENGVTFIGHRSTLADVGQTVANTFDCKIQFGESFLSTIFNKIEVKQ